jgi:hypothetical protein
MNRSAFLTFDIRGIDSALPHWFRGWAESLAQLRKIYLVVFCCKPDSGDDHKFGTRAPATPRPVPESHKTDNELFIFDTDSEVRDRQQ